MTAGAAAHASSTALAGEPAATPAATPGDAFAGLGALVRLVLRRDRLRLALWTVAIVLLVLVSAASVQRLYDTPESLAGYARLVRGNAALIVQSGPGFGLEEPTVGAVLMNEVSMWTIIAVSLMSIFMVTRHTRAEEESERAELVRAAPVGRHAPASAALVGVLLANVVVAGGVAGGLLAFGFPPLGSLAFGAALIGAGSVFAGVALVTAQVIPSARAATGLAAVGIGVAFVLRAVGDVGNGALSWLSPIGWAQAVRAYADERWWALLLPLVATAGLVALADALAAHRDLGAGIVAERRGRAEAGPRLASPLGLAFRLQRAALVGWCVGAAAVGFFYGLVTDQVEAMVAENPDLADFFAQAGGGSLTDAFLATAMLVLALVASGFTISAVLRLRSEEVAGRAEPLLATPTSRTAWLASHLTVAAAGTVLVLATSGLATAVGYAAVTGDVAGVPRVVAAAVLVMVPAALVLAGAATALFGLLPGWSLLAWALLAVAVVVGLLGEVLGLPQGVRDLSPFQHTPALPAADLDVVPLVVLSCVAAALTAAGVYGFRRRDASADGLPGRPASCPSTKRSP